jgi:hypothetical protein
VAKTWLLQNLGKGFDISNLKNMRQFYLVFPNGDALRRQLSWTHYRLIMRVNKKEARNKLQINYLTPSFPSFQ